MQNLHCKIFKFKNEKKIYWKMIRSITQHFYGFEPVSLPYTYSFISTIPCAQIKGNKI